MPAKIDVDSNLRFLYACFKNSNYSTIDYQAVAAHFEIKPPAARMRLMRLKTALDGASAASAPSASSAAKDTDGKKALGRPPNGGSRASNDNSNSKSSNDSKKKRKGGGGGGTSATAKGAGKRGKGKAMRADDVDDGDGDDDNDDDDDDEEAPYVKSQDDSDDEKPLAKKRRLRYATYKQEEDAVVDADGDGDTIAVTETAAATRPKQEQDVEEEVKWPMAEGEEDVIHVKGELQYDSATEEKDRDWKHCGEGCELVQDSELKCGELEVAGKLRSGSTPVPMSIKLE